MSYDQLLAAAAHIATRSGRPHHDVGLVLGSGLGDYAAGLDESVAIPGDEIPHYPVPRVTGHTGSLVSGLLEGHRVLAAAGRVHAYEGRELADVVFGVRAMALAGCRTVVLTNAAGGIDPELVPGMLVTIRDHINTSGGNPLVGANDGRLGPRFPDLGDVYTAAVRAEVAAACADVGEPYREAVYAWWLGPSYETPAEIEMLRRMGADLVGMSTAPEAIALAHMGVALAAISLVTNPAAGVGAEPLSHDAVTEVAAGAAPRLRRLLDALLPRLAARNPD